MGHLLVEQRQAHLARTDDGHQLFKVRHLARIGRLVPQHPDMMGQAAPVYVVRPFTKQVEHLGERQGYNKIVGAVRVADNEESRRPLVPQLVQLHFVIAHNFPELGDVKGGQPCATANKDRAGGFAAGKAVLAVLLHRKAIRLALFQPGKHIVHRVHKVRIVLFHLHAGDHIHQRVHVPVLRWPLKNDIGNQGAVQERFRFRPKRISLLALALGVGDQGIDEFQDVGLVADIGQGVIVHGF